MPGGAALSYSTPLEPIPGTPVTGQPQCAVVTKLAPIESIPPPPPMSPRLGLAGGPAGIDVLSSQAPPLTVAPLPATADLAPLSFVPSEIAKCEEPSSMDSVPLLPPGLSLSTGQGAIWSARAATLQLAKHRALPLKVRLPPHLEHARLDMDPAQPAKKSQVYAEFGAGAVEFAHKIDTCLPLKKHVPDFLLDDSQGVVVVKDVPR